MGHQWGKELSQVRTNVRVCDFKQSAYLLIYIEYA